VATPRSALNTLVTACSSLPSSLASRRGLAAQAGGQVLAGAAHAAAQLGEPARQPHGVAAVAEVAFDLAGDRRGRERGQLGSAAHVEAVDRLDQPDRADLHQVLVVLAAARVASRDRRHQRHVQLHQARSGPGIAPQVVLAQQAGCDLRRRTDFAVTSGFVHGRTSRRR
jgi:hypothetical protein